MATVPSPDDLARVTLSLRSAEVANSALKHELVDAQRAQHAAELAHARVASEASSYADFATRELAARDVALRELREQHMSLQASSALALQEVNASAVAERATLEADAAAREHALRLDLTQAKLQMERSLAFLEVQDALKRQVAELQEKLLADADAHKLYTIEQERKFLATKSDMTKQLAVMRSSIMGEARAEALATLTAEQRRVLKDNKEMAGELVATSVEARVAARDLAELADARTQLRREVADLRAGESAWAERCAANAARAKAAEAARAAAEGAAAAAAAAAAAEAAALRAQFSRESEALRAEAAGLRELLDLKNKELRTVKRLALIVLQQRTDVEQFFLDALAEVKAEVLGRKRAAAAAELANATAELGASAARARLLQPAQALLRFLPPAPLHPPRAAPPAPAPAPAPLPGEEGGTARPLTLQLSRAKPSAVRAAAAAIAAAGGGSGSGGEAGGGSGGSAAAAAVAAAAGGAGASDAPPPVTLVTLATAAAKSALEPARVAALGAGPSDVDLFDLRPEDRERVLRILFAKMGGRGSGATPSAAAAATSRRAEAEAREELEAEEAAADGEDGKDRQAGSRVGAGEMRGPFGLAASLPVALGGGGSNENGGDTP
jgi:hypothetical protein